MSSCLINCFLSYKGAELCWIEATRLAQVYIVIQCTVAGQVRSGQASDVTGHA